MAITIPIREEAKLWLLEQDGSAKPLSTYLAEQDMLFEDLEDDYDQAHPEQRNRQVGKDDYTPYKQGGSKRTK